MIAVYNIFMIILWGLLCPFCLGTLECCITGRYERISVAKQFCFGFAIELFVFGVLAVPLIFFRASYLTLKYSWLACILPLCVFAIYILFKHRSDFFAREVKSDTGRQTFTVILWIVAVVIIAFETGLLTVRMHMDTDDARFVAEALDAIDSNTLLAVNPITGRMIGGDGIPKAVPIGEMRKDAASPYPIFLGLISDLFGVNPAVCAHTVMPLLLIPLSYASFYLIAVYFLGDDKKKTGMFLLFLSVALLFSFESVFAPGYTLLNIIWQGRSIAASMMLPLLSYALIRTQINTRIALSDLFILLMLNIGCVVLSGTAAIIAAVVTLGYAVAKVWDKRDPRVLIWIGITAVPDVFCLVYGQYILKKIFKF